MHPLSARPLRSLAQAPVLTRYEINRSSPWSRSLVVNRDTVLSRLVAAALMAATLALCLIVLGSGRLAASGEGAVPRPQQDAAPPTQGAADAAPAQSGYVGPETCLTCHDTATLHGTAHGNPRIPGSPAADKGCESCHGPGQAHVEDDAKGHILKFSQMPARQVSDTCLTCHNKTEHAMWDSSSHAARNMGCVSCHSVHAPKSERGQLVKATQLELCATCHKPQ